MSPLRSATLLLALALLGVVALRAPEPVGSENGLYLVDTTSDSAALNACLTPTAGDCSLRGAITRANIAPGAIQFINFGTPLISISSPLPALALPMNINGLQPDGEGRVELRPAATTTATDGLIITGPGIVVQNLVINSFAGSGIFVNGAAAGVTIAHNRIGTSADGETDLGNTSLGVNIAGSAVAVVVVDNIISGNNTGGVLIQQDAHHNTVTDNIIGLSDAGNALKNTGFGVKVRGPSHDNMIGGDAEGEGNYVAFNKDIHNSNAGIEIVRGLFDDEPAVNNTVQNNRVGLGFFDDEVGSNFNGVRVTGATGTVIKDNVISGNEQYGLELTDVSGTLIAGNVIGANSDGSAAVPNGIGIFLKGTSTNNDIGDPNQPPNVISGNNSAGITMGANTSDTRILGNHIGVDADGDSALPNSGDGVQLVGTDHTIGDGTDAGRNIIAGNGESGILLTGATTSGNTISNNNIGLGSNDEPLGNERHGIRILAGASNNNIVANTIAFNAEDAVSAEPNAADESIANNLLNFSYSNGGLAIDLGDDGVTANDTHDADAGPNNLQNFPVIASAIASGPASATVSYTIDSTPLTQLRVLIFANTECDPSGSGETERGAFTGTNRTSDANGHLQASVGTSAAIGEFVSMTVRDNDGNTSEVSNCVEVVAPPATPTPSATPVGQTPTPTPTPSPTPTQSPTQTAPPTAATATATPTPTASPSPTPVETPSSDLVQGNLDCLGGLNITDLVLLLEFVALLNDGDLPDPCPDLNDDDPSSDFPWGDVNCDGAVDAVDALFLIAHLGGFGLAQFDDSCVDIGSGTT